jgi:hypothetical protein
MSIKESIVVPSVETLTNTARLSIQNDRPILYDYWNDENVFVGVKEGDEKLLVKNQQEYTSPIEKMFQSGKEYIIMTENSIYITKCSIQSKRIQ